MQWQSVIKMKVNVKQKKKKEKKSTKKSTKKRECTWGGVWRWFCSCVLHSYSHSPCCVFVYNFFSLSLSLSLTLCTKARAYEVEKNLRSITIIKILFFTHFRHITAAAEKGEWEADDLWLLFGDECIWECYKHKKNCFLRLTFVWHWNSLLPYHFSAVLQLCRHFEWLTRSLLMLLVKIYLIYLLFWWFFL